MRTNSLEKMNINNNHAENCICIKDRNKKYLFFENKFVPLDSCDSVEWLIDIRQEETSSHCICLPMEYNDRDILMDNILKITKDNKFAFYDIEKQKFVTKFTDLIRYGDSFFDDGSYLYTKNFHCLEDISKSISNRQCPICVIDKYDDSSISIFIYEDFFFNGNLFFYEDTKIEIKTMYVSETDNKIRKIIEEFYLVKRICDNYFSITYDVKKHISDLKECENCFIKFIYKSHSYEYNIIEHKLYSERIGDSCEENNIQGDNGDSWETLGREEIQSMIEDGADIEYYD